MLLARRWRWIDRVSPMAVLYAVGLLVANLSPWPHGGQAAANSAVGNLCIPLAIPLMLLSCRPALRYAGTTAKALLSGLAAVLATTAAGFFLFRGNYDQQTFAQVCAVSVGIYTGGIPNMGAIAQGVGMDHDTYLYVTSYDLVVTGLYLLFVICFGRPVFRRLLPASHTPPDDTARKDEALPAETERLPKAAETALPLLLTVLIAGSAFLLSTLLPQDLRTPALILLLTTFSIAASFLPPVRRLNRHADRQGRHPRSFSIGLYFVYTFCFTMANACDIRQMDFAGSLNILWYILFVIFGSLALQILFARLLRLDGDSALVASIALINSPPFVPLVAALLDNKDLVIVGITIGMVGYLLGNYLGLGLFLLLRP